jgi:hypothetical protein
MAFSQSEITGVNVQADGPQIFITWTSSAPAGSFFQVYVDGRLAWYGTAPRCYAPIPASANGRNVWVDVGTVDPSEVQADFSSSLTSASQGGPQVQFSWTGGTYLDATGNDDVQGFRIYRGDSPGAAVDWSAPVGHVPAYPGGWICDGFGLGGFGLGGFGRAASSYTWSMPGLASGAWQFAIVPYDREGNNRGTGQAVGVNVIAAPRAPAAPATGPRLTYAYSGPGSRQITLSWLPSPS